MATGIEDIAAGKVNEMGNRVMAAGQESVSNLWGNIWSMPGRILSGAFSGALWNGAILAAAAYFAPNALRSGLKTIGGDALAEKFDSVRPEANNGSIMPMLLAAAAGGAAMGAGGKVAQGIIPGGDSGGMMGSVASIGGMLVTAVAVGALLKNSDVSASSGTSSPPPASSNRPGASVVH